MSSVETAIIVTILLGHLYQLTHHGLDFIFDSGSWLQNFVCRIWLTSAGLWIVGVDKVLIGRFWRIIA